MRAGETAREGHALTHRPHPEQESQSAFILPAKGMEMTPAGQTSIQDLQG